MTPSGMFATEEAIDHRRLRRARSVLVGLIVLTCLLPLAFVQPDEAPWHVNLVKYLAKTGAFVGSMLLVWQFLLGFRGAVSSVLPDLTWVVDLHKKLGMYGVPVLLLHPVFIGVYYAMEEDRNIFALDLDTAFSRGVLLGMLALALVAIVVLVSVLLKDRLGFYPWLYSHMSAYLIPPLMLVHSFQLGPTVRGTGLQYYWWAVTAVVVVLAAWRVLHKLGVGSRAYRVVDTRTVGEDTTEVVMEPERGHHGVQTGQFVYLRRGWTENSHPYTVSGYARSPGRLCVTAQEQGPQTAALQDIPAGRRLLVDGPFGVFTRVSTATDRPLVMIAGGIGITAFRRLWQRLEEEGTRPAHLFYSADDPAQLTYQEELESLEHVGVTFMIDDGSDDDDDGGDDDANEAAGEDEAEGEDEARDDHDDADQADADHDDADEVDPDTDLRTGRVDVDLLAETLEGDLEDHQFLICGPPPMILDLEEQLHEAGVPAEQVAHELFAS